MNAKDLFNLVMSQVEGLDYHEAKCKVQSMPGFFYIDNGCFGCVMGVQGHDDLVVKVNYATDGYLAYAAYCMAKPGPLFPKVYAYGLSTNGRVGVVVMEKLQDRCKAHDSKDYMDLGNVLHSGVLQPGQENNPKFVAALEMSKFFGEFVGYDLHGGNWMCNMQGELVLTDPFSSLYGTTIEQAIEYVKHDGNYAMAPEPQQIGLPINRLCTLANPEVNRRKAEQAERRRLENERLAQELQPRPHMFDWAHLLNQEVVVNVKPERLFAWHPKQVKYDDLQDIRAKVKSNGQWEWIVNDIMKLPPDVLRAGRNFCPSMPPRVLGAGFDPMEPVPIIRFSPDECMRVREWGLIEQQNRERKLWKQRNFAAAYGGKHAIL